MAQHKIQHNKPKIAIPIRMIKGNHRPSGLYQHLHKNQLTPYKSMKVRKLVIHAIRTILRGNFCRPIKYLHAQNT